MNPKGPEYIAKKQMEIDRKMKQIASRIDTKGVVTDGIFSPKDYERAKVKILWLLREPHDEGGWPGRKAIREKFQSYAKGEGEGKGWKYFDVMSYVLYSAQNGYLAWNDIPWAHDHIEIRRLILSIAFVNCNKIPGGATINEKQWWERTEKFWPIVSEQIALAAPDVIICGGTKDYLEKHHFFHDCDAKGQIGETGRHYYKNKSSGQVILDCYHIGQRNISQQKYIDGIIEVLKKEKIAGPK